MIGHSLLSYILIGFVVCFAHRIAEYWSVIGRFAEYYLDGNTVTAHANPDVVVSSMIGQ